MALRALKNSLEHDHDPWTYSCLVSLAEHGLDTACTTVLNLFSFLRMTNRIHSTFRMSCQGLAVHRGP